MDFRTINWLAVIVCVLVVMFSGGLWFNQKTFFPIWWRAMGKTEMDDPGSGNMGLLWTLTVVSAIVQVIFMALFVKAMGTLMGGPTAVTGLLTGFLLWFGFVATTHLTNKLFEGHGLKVWALEMGNHLINYLLIGAILGAWH